MATFNFFDSNASQMSDPNTASFHLPSNSPSDPSNSGTRVYPAVNHDGFQIPISIPNLGTNNNFQTASSGTSLLGSSESVGSHELADLLKNPKALELYKSWHDSSSIMSQSFFHIVQQNGDLQRSNGNLQQSNSELQQKIAALQNQASTQSSEISALKLEIDQLKKDVHYMKKRSNSSPTRHDSASQIAQISSSTYQHQPATRPERFPQSILWTLKDAQDAHLVLESNKSRPSMEKCVRNEDGSSISVDQWRSIKLTARTIAQTDLLSLPVPNKAKAIPRTKIYYKKNYIKAWWDAIQQLEERQPLLRLCAANWKADHVLGATLLARVSEAKQQLRRMNMYTMSDDEEERGVGDRAGGSRHKRRNDFKYVSDVETSSEEEAEPKQKRRKVSDKPRKKRPSHRIDHIDISTLCVGSSFSSLKDEISKSFSRPIPFATTLLNAMEAQPNLEVGPASEDVIEFLSRLDNADPNSTEYSEEDLSACWGHRQFTSGNLTCSSVLTSWREVGSVEMACKLIAAALKTCKVARHISILRGMDTKSYYLSDAYLENMIEKLWRIWERQFITASAQSTTPLTALPSDTTIADPLPTSNPPTAQDSQTPGGSDLNLRSALQALQKEELKQLIAKRQVVAPSNNKLQIKEDMISAITNFFHPSEALMDDIKSIIEARKNKRPGKRTVSAASTSTSK